LGLGSNKSISAFLTVFSGTAGGQVLAIVLVPIVTRIYRPDHYGVASLIITLATFLSLTCFFGYNRALLLPKEDSEAEKLFYLSTFSLVVSCLLTFAICAVGYFIFPQRQLIIKLQYWIFATPAVLLFMGAGNLLQTVTTRKRKYSRIAISEASAGLLVPGCRIGLGFITGSTIHSLLLASVFALVVRAYILFTTIPDFVKNSFTNFNRRQVFETARNYKDFPQLFFPTALLNALSRNMPIVIIGIFFPVDIAGFFAMAERLIKIPLSAVSESILKVLTPTYAEKTVARQPLQSLFLKSTFALSALGIPFIALFVFFGERTIEVLLGSNWRLSGRFALLLIPVLFSEYIQYPASIIFLVLRKQDVRLGLQTLHSLATATSLIGGCIYFKNAEKTILLYSVLISLFNFALIIIGFFTIRKWETATIQPTG
jgi:O-antigen/teichoic acid export membrane protein